MKLTHLLIQNFKGVKRIEVVPAKPLTKIAAANASGKTSALDGFAALLGGARWHGKAPVTAGEPQSDLLAEFDGGHMAGGVTVKKAIKADGGYRLEVYQGQGKSPVNAPQSFIDLLIGKGLMLDVEAYLRMEPDKRLEITRQLVGLDFSALDTESSALDKERAFAGRDVHGRKQQLDSMPEYPDAPGTEQSSSAILSEIQEAMRTNEANRKAREQVEAAEEDVANANATCENSRGQAKGWEERERQLADRAGKADVAVDDLHSHVAALKDIDTSAIEAQIIALQQQLRDANAANAKNAFKRVDLERAKSDLAAANREAEFAYKTLHDWLAKIERDAANLEARRTTATQLAAEATKLLDVDVKTIEAKLAGAEAINKKVQANAARRKLRDQFDMAKATYDDLTEKINEIGRKKARMLREAKFPVPGMSFGLTDITYNGTPFSECSSAERIRITTAMALALAPKRPDAIVCPLIRNGSLLDDASMKVIEELIADADAQCFVEVVMRDAQDVRDADIVIEEGVSRPTK